MATQETLETTQGGGRDQETGTKPKRVTKLKSLRIKEEGSLVREGRGMPQEIDIEKHPERDMEIGDREEAA